jgi:hypothetical protein
MVGKRLNPHGGQQWMGSFITAIQQIQMTKTAGVRKNKPAAICQLYRKMIMRAKFLWLLIIQPYRPGHAKMDKQGFTRRQKWQQNIFSAPQWHPANLAG